MNNLVVENSWRCMYVHNNILFPHSFSDTVVVLALAEAVMVVVAFVCSVEAVVLVPINYI